MARIPYSVQQSPTISMSPQEADDSPFAEAALYLLVIEQGSSFVFHLPAKPEVNIGRSTEADLQLQHSSVSRRHARLFWQHDALLVQDMGSHNGVRINGERVDGPRQLASGDVISVGEVLLALHRGAAAPERRPLPDLTGLRRCLAEEIERALRHQYPLALLYLDLGSAASHSGLDVTALQRHLRPLEQIAQLGDSQLAIVMPEVDEEELREQSAQLLEQLPAAARGGYALCPEDGCGADMLLLIARQAAAAAAAGSLAGAAAIPVTKAIGSHQILVADPAMMRLYDLIERIGPSPMPVLIIGETGSGKELAAAALHHHSPRRGRRLLAVNCAALPESLAESELFGHERGAFTGANTAKAGLLESASGGTLFLDEIGELSLPIQAKLLRALETRRIMRVGDTQERSIDLRIIAATHRDLDADARAGRFRQDLFFRLAAAVVSLPPLRHRLVELPMLARAFLLAARKHLGRSPLAFSGQAMARLLAHPWPGNVRELKNDMEFLAATVQEGAVELWQLPQKFGGVGPLSSAGGRAESNAKPAALRFRPLEEEIREIERKRIAEALAAAGGVQSQAAELLSVPRRTFFAKSKQYGLSPRVRKETSEDSGGGTAD